MEELNAGDIRFGDAPMDPLPGKVSPESGTDLTTAQPTSLPEAPGAPLEPQHESIVPQAVTDDPGPIVAVPAEEQPPQPAPVQQHELASAAVEEDEETDSDLDVPPPPEEAMAAAAAAAAAPAPARPLPPAAHTKSAVGSGSGRGRGGGRGGIITLKLLIDEGIIDPGEDVFSVEYKGMTHSATLLPDGRIQTVVEGQQYTFESPSAFSIYLKRLINPSRKADDGWKTVKYRGRLLEHYKHELVRSRMGIGGLSGEGAASTASLEALESRATKRARTDFTFLAAQTAAHQGMVPEQERPRRVRRVPPRFAAIGVDDERSLQPLEAYGPGEAPFMVRASPAAEIIMDYHAHLCMNEVIGILAGTWDRETKRIDIVRAVPVRELEAEGDSISVEMDPEDQIAKIEEITKAGLRVVGWYHSHPTFPATPSTVDIYNQVLQQHAHREEGHAAAEPYVAAIISPYDPQMTSATSKLTWFYVAHAPGAVPAEGQRPDEVGCEAKQLMTEPLLEPAGALENLVALQREMEQLAKLYAPDPDRANLEGMCPDGSLRIEKLVSSVQSWLPEALLGEAKIRSFASKMWVSTRAVWNIYGKPAAAVLASAADTQPGVSTASGSAPASTAVSQGVVEDAHGANGHEEDEPISDDEDTV